MCVEGKQTHTRSYLCIGKKKTTEPTESIQTSAESVVRQGCPVSSQTDWMENLNSGRVTVS
jgi:hypothetical protein